MKILQIIPSFGMGGAEKVVLNYMQAAKKADLDFVAISLYPPTGSVYDEIIKREKLNVIYLHKKKGFDMKVILELKKEIARINPDIVHTHLYALKYYFLTEQTKKYKNFHTVHSIPKEDALGIDYWMNRYFFRNNRAIPIALHEGLIDEINRYYKTSTAVAIENGIFVDDYITAEKDKKMQHEFGIEEADFVIGHVGKFKKVKNHRYLLDVFEEIYRRNPRAKLLLVGDGELNEEIKQVAIEKEIQNKIIFAGNREDIPSMLKLMDVFVFPSEYEGLGLAVIEAQLAGIPCVASVNVPKETKISDGITYLKLTDKSEWAQRIMECQNKTLHLNDNEKKYDINRIIEKLVELYER